MFTGIIEEIGKVKVISKRDQGYQIEFVTKKLIDDLKTGDSIAVNGVCLTVTKRTKKSFQVDVMPETLSKTNLGKLQTGSYVNLERALSVTSRLGGHLVSGHIDGVGEILSRMKYKNAVLYRVEIPVGLLTYIIPKGSVTIDGISLTVVNTGVQYFEVSIVPYTLKNTVLQDRRPGDVVNIECDLFSKYIRHFLKIGIGNLDVQDDNMSSLSKEFLLEHGFG
ncbi:MAG: riboflavin synthase [Candidatus Hodarchaeales archaeon]